MNRRQEEIETKILENTGAVIQPDFNPIRPLWIGLALSVGSFLFLNDHVPESVKDVGSYLSTKDLSAITFDVYMTMDIAGNYFKDQLMTPPKKKKKLLTALYEKAFPGKLEPVKIPTQRYESIDSIVIS